MEIELGIRHDVFWKLTVHRNGGHEKGGGNNAETVRRVLAGIRTRSLWLTIGPTHVLLRTVPPRPHARMIALFVSFHPVGLGLSCVFPLRRCIRYHVALPRFFLL